MKTKKATKPKPEPKYCDWCGCEMKEKIYRVIRKEDSRGNVEFHIYDAINRSKTAMTESRLRSLLSRDYVVYLNHSSFDR